MIPGSVCLYRQPRKQPLIDPIKVNKNGDIPMTLAGFGFIKTKRLQATEIQTAHGGLLKQQGETAAFARPRNRDLLDLMFWATNTRN